LVGLCFSTVDGAPLLRKSGCQNISGRSCDLTADTPPLPDKFFDWFDRKEWAFMVCEVIGLLLLALWLVNWALHKHR
jgi:hypothetical protein